MNIVEQLKTILRNRHVFASIMHRHVGNYLKLPSYYCEDMQYDEDNDLEFNESMQVKIDFGSEFLFVPVEHLLDEETTIRIANEWVEIAKNNRAEIELAKEQARIASEAAQEQRERQQLARLQAKYNSN